MTDEHRYFTIVQSKFRIGAVVGTPGASTLYEEDIQSAMIRYVQGDWGDICDEDKALNDEALKVGNRLLAEYKDRNGTRFWIITEADRSVTAILLPEEY